MHRESATEDGRVRKLDALEATSNGGCSGWERQRRQMSEFRIQKTRRVATSAPRWFCLTSEFCILTSDVFAVPN
jgi:hypothetical protein